MRVASVSLVVGGIGILERTREIGLRQALGAKTHDILNQFLAEAVTLSIASGVIGIVFGISASAIISRLAGWATSVGPALEAAQSGDVRSDVFRQELQGNTAVQLEVFGLINHTHPAAAQFPPNAVMRDGLADPGVAR